MRYHFKSRDLVMKPARLAAICMFYAVSTTLAQTADVTAADARSESEAIKRVERSLLYNKQLEEGAKLLAAGELKTARDRFKAVTDATENEPAFLETHVIARKGAAKTVAIQAAIEEKNKKYKAARSLLLEAVELDPTNSSYQVSLARVKAQTKDLEQQYPGNKAVTSELQEKIANIQRLMFEGDSFMETGQYSRAIGRYKEVLTIDEFNDNARKRIQKVEKIKYNAATVRKDARREKALYNVETEWPTVPIDRKEYTLTTAGQAVQQTGALRLYDKLEKIIIPELNFSEVDIADAVKFLEDQSRALDPDPDKTGVNFVLKAMPTASATPPADGVEVVPVPAPARTLTLSLKNVPLIQILNFINSLTNLQYKVDEHAVYIFPSNETSEVLVIRTFSVPPTFFPTSVRETSNPTGDFITRTIDIATVPVKEELEKKGVKFPGDSSAAYLPRTAKMVVKNTLDQLNLIDQLLSREVNQTKQIEVEAKFIDFADDKLKELSFNYRINGTADIPGAFGVFPNNAQSPAVLGTGPGFGVPFANSVAGNASAATALRTTNNLAANQLDALLGIGSNRQANQIGVSGIIGGSGARLLITALESALGSDLMSAPKLTLVSGQKSKIRVSRELIYPTEYDPPEIVQSTSDLAPPPIAVPSNPSSFETRDIGVTLEVKATATLDRRIDLELKPEVTEFQGFINYADDLRQSTQVGGAPPVITTIIEGVALTPVFAVRKVETKVQVIDGQTIVMGGFIREDKQMVEDKIPIWGDIPLVGRLFRSKVERSIKRNLVMLITARMMKPDGTPEYLTEGERESYEITLIPSEQAR